MPFTKGQRAYPDGRKLEAAVRRAAREEARPSIVALAAVRDDAAVAPEVRAQAAMKLLDLGRWNRRSASAPFAVAAQ